MEMEIDRGRVLYALPGLVWTALPGGRIDFVNRQWAEYTGLGLDEAHGGEWQAIVHPDDLPTVREWWLSMSASPEPSEIEVRLRRFDHVHRRFLVRCSPLFDDSGHLERWCGVGTDVEDLRKATDVREGQVLDFQLIVDSIPIPVAVTTPTGEVEGLNQATLDYFGRTLDELKGWTASDAVHPQDLESTLAAQLDAHRKGTSYNVESRHRRFDGVYRWFNVIGLPLRDADGQILRWFHLQIDIEDRKRIEEALRHTESESRMILDNIATLVSLLDANGNPELINRQILDYTGKSEEEVKKWDGNDLVHPEELASAMETFKAGVTSGTAFDIVFRMRRFDGAYRWFHGRHRPLVGAEGKVERWCVSLDDIDDRKRIEESLRTSEKNLRTTIDALPALVWSARTDGTAEFFNRHYLDYVGRNLEDVQDWGWIAAVHPDDLDRLKSVWVATMAAGARGECEARIQRFDGMYRWFLFRVDPLRDEDGTIVKWFGVNTDIEEQKRAEQALAASELDARLIVDSIDAMIALFTPEGVLSGGNQQLLDYFQLPLQEVMKWATNGITHPDDLQHCIDSFMASIESGEPYAFETRFRRFDGVFRWFQIRGLPHRDAQGRIVRWYGLLTDIDDRKHAEEELKRSELLLAAGQRLSSTGTFSWLVDTDELTFSDELKRIFAFDLDEVVTFDKILGRVHAEDLPLIAEKMAEVRSGRDNPEYDNRLLMADGSIKHVRVFGRLLEHDNGRLESVGAVQDVTQSRLAEQAHEELRSELAHVTRVTSLGAMAASIAHEVNQPLSGIITNASTCLRMLAAEPPNVDGARETARRTIRDGNRAADVITRLRLLFSKKVATVEEIDLNEAVREVMALCWSDLQRGRVSLRAELDEGIPLVPGDRVQLQQVVMNLLRNAADAVADIDDRPRQILLTTAVNGDGAVRLSVSDSGIGFGASDPDRIFDAFYTTKSEGMGIGLAVSRTIIESNGGRLWAERNDGPGATFSFVIPGVSGEQAIVPSPDGMHYDQQAVL
jgi:PAS domain S-box-containing protein